MRLLLADREQLVVALDDRPEVRPLVPDAALVQEREDQIDRLLLDVAPRVEVAAEALELVGPVAGAQAEHHPTAREDVHEGHVLDHADRVVEGQRHHRGAEADARGPGRQVAHVGEDVRHDAVLVREVVLGHPRGVVAQAVGGLDLGGDPGVDGAVRVGLAGVVRVRGEQDAEFHAERLRNERELASSLAETVLPEEEFHADCPPESGRDARELASSLAESVLPGTGRPRVMFRGPIASVRTQSTRRVETPKEGTPWPIRYLIAVARF